MVKISKLWDMQGLRRLARMNIKKRETEISSVLVLRATSRTVLKVDVVLRRRKRPHLYRFPELRSGVECSRLYEPQN